MDLVCTLYSKFKRELYCMFQYLGLAQDPCGHPVLMFLWTEILFSLSVAVLSRVCVCVCMRAGARVRA